MIRTHSAVSAASLLVLSTACGGGGGGGVAPGATSPGVAPTVPPQVITGAAVQAGAPPPGGAVVLDLVAPGRGLLVDDGSGLVALDGGGFVRRMWTAPSSAIVSSAALAGGCLYATTFDVLDATRYTLLRLDATAATQNQWRTAGPAGVSSDDGGHVYLGESAPPGTGSGWDTLSGLDSYGYHAWTVECGGEMLVLDAQQSGLLVSGALAGGTNGYASIDDDGIIDWQKTFDAGASGATIDELAASGDGGAYGGCTGGVLTVSPAGVVRYHASAPLGETLSVRPARVPDEGLATPLRRHFLALGSAGGVFHLRQVEAGLAVVRVGLAQPATALETWMEPATGDVLARAQTASGAHVLRLTPSGVLRWSKDTSGYAALAGVHALADGGALFVLGAPSGGGAPALVSIGSLGAVNWALEAADLPAGAGGHKQVRLSDGGRAVAWGRTLATVGPSAEFRAIVAMSQPLGVIQDLAATVNSGVALVGQSSGQPSAALWTVDVQGGSNASCLMSAAQQNWTARTVPDSVLAISLALLPHGGGPFTAADSTAFMRTVVEQSSPAGDWTAAGLATADPCAGQ